MIKIGSGFRVKNSNTGWHRSQIAYDRSHYPPKVAGPKIRWHVLQIQYDKRNGDVTAYGKGKVIK